MMDILHVYISHEPNRYYTLTDLSKQCGIPVSSMHRILNAMIKHGMIHQDHNKKMYGLGSLWLEYGLKMYDTLDYVSIVRPELEQLMHDVQASVYLSKPVEMESIIIERIDCINQTIHAHDQLGLRTSLHKGKRNLVMLAYMPRHIKEKVIQNFIPQNEQVHFEQQLEDIKLNGFAIENHLSNQLTTIAAPILNHYGELIGAVNIKIDCSTFTDDQKKQTIHEVINTANKISWKMGQKN